MNVPRRTDPRPGLSLLEVLVALAIFLIGMTVLGQMVNLASQQALEVQYQAQATQLCQAKLAEVNAGVLPLTSQSETAMEEDPAWVWSVQAEQQQTPNLWRVNVRVSRGNPAGNPVECVMSQMVFDPAMRGSALDPPPTIAGSDSGSAGTSSSGQGGRSSGGSSPSSGGSSGSSGSTSRPPSGGSGPSTGTSGGPSGKPTGSPAGPTGGGPSAPPGGSQGPGRGGRP